MMRFKPIADIYWPNLLTLTHFCLAYLFYNTGVHACGGVTHIEISYRALSGYHDTYGPLSYDTIVRENQDALEAGSVFPDSFYSNFCFDGKFHDVSEDTHWTPFINASINYIIKNYPKPWDQKTLKLVAFIMGIMSHQVADVSWHALGIDQGFLVAMAGTNYHGDFPSAHSDGDLGGDVLNLFQLNLNYSDIIGEWYVPVGDVLNIYQDYYGKEAINKTVVVTCTKLMYLVKIAERVLVKKYFPITAKKSPFIVNELYRYFLGGITDMAAWTQRIWKHLTYALEFGSKDCNMDHNPLFFRCNHTKLTSPSRMKRTFRNNIVYNSAKTIGLSMNDVVVDLHSRGMHLKPASSLKKKLQMFADETLENKENLYTKTPQASGVEYPTAVFTIGIEYAGLGWAYAVADLNKDGNEDVVIGCPGYMDPASQQQTGTAFILFGTDNGLNTSITDITKAADIQIQGPLDSFSSNSCFGSSVAIFDMDQDGKLDIAIGAPSFGSSNLTYNGKVFVYAPVDSKSYSLKAFMDCPDVYCTLGTTLRSEDINSDNYSDLLISSPFAPGGGVQRGMVTAVLSDRKYAGKMDLHLTMSTTILHGTQNYSWFGYSLAIKKISDRNETYIAIGEPNLRKCARTNCSFDPNDVQAIGQVHINSVSGSNIIPGPLILGQQQFQMLGGQLDIGRPFDQATDVIAVASTGQDVKGSVSGVPLDLEQAGSLYLYNLSDPQQPITIFNGDRKFARFGATVKFTDTNRDGVDDLIIGAPLRTDDITEELTGAQQGRVYVWLGGPSFPRGDATSKCGPFYSIEPCPGFKASRELGFKEDLARFGSQFAVLRFRKKTQLLVTAEHSSLKARLAGAIGVFEL
ncbi:unnamed protein product [Lymnaea stagnalis]|uniref:Phosphatidylinositol-glycan-specific phospholipase D n=1 Tax=Lymnaea stagnalis TaxID=6523 RepID=A0AAV2I4H7_LYMST